MNTFFSAVLHIGSSLLYNKVHDLATKVIESMSTNSEVFKTPDPTMAVLKTKNDLLATAIAKAEGGDHTEIINRNDISEEVYGMLKTQIDYVNKLANGDKFTISLSGFDVNDESEPHPVPDQIQIKRIEKGKEENTIKVFIHADTNAMMYKLECTETPEDLKSWVTILETTSSTKLFARNVPKDKKLFYRISGGNTAGWGLQSLPVPFILY